MSWKLILKRPETTTFVVKDAIWNEAGGEGMDTILDLERKLERKLSLNDFDDSPANWNPNRLNDLKNNYPETYEILMDRIGGIEGMKKLAGEYLKRTANFPNRFSKTPDNELDAKKLIKERLQ